MHKYSLIEVTHTPIINAHRSIHRYHSRIAENIIVELLEILNNYHK